jgi:hypothetical protein
MSQQDSNSTAAPAQSVQKNDTTPKIHIPILAGLGAAVLGLGVWILLCQKFQVLWMAPAIAYGIANAVKYTSKSKKPLFGLYSVLLSVIVAIIGNLTTAIMIMSKTGTPALQLASELNVDKALLYLSILSKDPINLLFYAATIVLGFWFAFKHQPTVMSVD